MSNSRLIADIRALQESSKVLDPDNESRKVSGNEVINYANDFLGKIDERTTFIQSGYDDTALSDTDFSKGHDVSDVLQLLKDHMEAPGINTAHGGHLGYIPGGGLYAAALGDYIADITNKYAGVFYASPGAVRIENALIEWTGKLVGYEQGFGGNLTSGGSIANLVAITTARDAKQVKAKDFHRLVIYTTPQAHHCIDKAIIIAGLRESIVWRVAMDGNYRMDVAALEQLITEDLEEGNIPFMVIANAGSTDVGAIDPLQQISEVAKKYDMWMHVDGAYGGYFMLLDEYKQKMKGIEQADSVVLDPHKGMFLPYGTGIVLVKQLHHLQNAFRYEASYMQDTVGVAAGISPADVSPELSKHFRGMRMWLPLKLYGEQAFKDCLQEKILLTQYFCEEIQKLGFELVCQPELSVAAYRFVPKEGDANEFNKRLLEMMHADGDIFISSTNLGGMYVLRFACLSFRTHIEHVDRLLQMFKRALKEMGVTTQK
ncbi:MAG: aminotransferase class V-fold PLP-dependent enzyme [Chitinophagales bacterium]|nr:aminotransferase class V-fold PLP-dependent enzyme [Chitinophagaceae bacterium]MCB9063559.1 aminotransferase class V-fold PLP-dependent enzyme [Chitinophagales bacterium]